MRKSCLKASDAVKPWTHKIPQRLDNGILVYVQVTGTPAGAGVEDMLALIDALPRETPLPAGAKGLAAELLVALVNDDGKAPSSKSRTAFPAGLFADSVRDVCGLTADAPAADAPAVNGEPVKVRKPRNRLTASEPAAVNGEPVNG